jgi:hypothetical protein
MRKVRREITCICIRTGGPFALITLSAAMSRVTGGYYPTLPHAICFILLFISVRFMQVESVGAVLSATSLRIRYAFVHTHDLKPIRHTDPRFHLLLCPFFNVRFRDRNRPCFLSRNPPTLRIFASAEAGSISTSRPHSDSTSSPAWFLSTSHPMHWRDTYFNLPSFH